MQPEAVRPASARLRSAIVALLGGLVIGVLVWPLVGLLSSWLLLPKSFEPLALGLILIMIGGGTVVGWAYDPDRYLGADHLGGPDSSDVDRPD